MAKGKTTQTTTMVPKGSTVSLCSCDNAYQDAKYGKYKRIFNIAAKGLRCTACGTLK